MTDAPKPSTTKFCRDCNYMEGGDEDGNYSRCERPSAPISVVTGKPQKLYCLLERTIPSTGDGCGEQGRYWEAR